MLHTPANAYRPFIIMTYTTHTVHVAANGIFGADRFIHVCTLVHTKHVPALLGQHNLMHIDAHQRKCSHHSSPTSSLWPQLLEPSFLRSQASSVLSPPIQATSSKRIGSAALEPK